MPVWVSAQGRRLDGSDLHFSAALHDGPLHKDPVGCQQFSDCGYGVRVMPRLGIEIAYRVRPAATVSLVYDHMSHKWIIDGENESLDHIGVRFRLLENHQKKRRDFPRRFSFASPCDQAAWAYCALALRAASISSGP